MDKMVLMPAEQYRALKNGSNEPKKEASDVKMAKFQDSFIREQNAKKITEEQNWENVSSRLKPIFSSQQADVQKMLKSFPSNQQDQAKSVLNLLARLPKVTLSAEQLLVDGQPMTDSLTAIVRDIMRNDVRGVESLIQALRRGQRTIPPQLAMETIDIEDSPSLYTTVVPNMKQKQTFDEGAMDSFVPYTPLLLHSTEPPLSSTPRKVTPIKTAPRMSPKNQSTSFEKQEKIPKVQRTPMGTVPRVQRSPIKTRSKVQRSPISVKTDDLPIKQSAKKQETYWVSY